MEREEKDKTAKKKTKKNKKKTSETDFCISREKIEAWSKDAFKFWNTAEKKPAKDKTKHITWLEI